MKEKDLTEILVFTFLNHKHKWITSRRLSQASGLPHNLVLDFLGRTDIIQRAKTKNKKNEVLYALTTEAKSNYKLERLDLSHLFSGTKSILLKGQITQGIEQFYATLREHQLLIPDLVYNYYQGKLNELSGEYFQLKDLWESNSISTSEKYKLLDQYAYELYESILNLEGLLNSIEQHKYSYKNVVITIDYDFEKFSKNDAEKAITDIAYFLNIPREELNLKSLEKGSVIMTLEFEDSSQAEQLFLLIKLGKLQSHGIKDANLKTLAQKVNTLSKQQDSLATLCKTVKIKIQNGNTLKAVDLLLEAGETVPKSFQNELILISSELNHLKKDELLGFKDFEKVRTTRNRITFSVLHLIDRLQAEYDT